MNCKKGSTLYLRLIYREITKLIKLMLKEGSEQESQVKIVKHVN